MCCRSIQHFTPGTHKFYTKAPNICGQSVRNLQLVTPALSYKLRLLPESTTNHTGRSLRVTSTRAISAWCYTCTSSGALAPSVGQRNVPEILYNKHALRNVYNILKKNGTMVAFYHRTTHFRRLRWCSMQEVLRTLQCPQLTTCQTFKQETKHWWCLCESKCSEHAWVKCCWYLWIINTIHIPQ